MRELTEAAAAAVAREIATLRREAQREREIRDAEHRARLAELESLRASIAATDREIKDRLATLKDGEPGRSVTIDDVTPLIERQVAEAVGAMAPPPLPDIGKMVADAIAAIPVPKGIDGIDVGLADETTMVLTFTLGDTEHVFEVELIRGAPGKDADPELVATLVSEKVREAVEALPPAAPGRDADPELVATLVSEKVREAVDALPPAAPGKDADPELVATLVSEKVREAVEALPPPEKGDRGPVGSLPVVRAWEDRVYYDGDVVSHAGALYQADCDTGREPPHTDWICIVAAGSPGKDADEIEVRSTYDPEESYRRLNIVALGGAAFIARKDDPGPCPGEGWQVIAMQGKQGKPGQSIKGDRGAAATVSAISISDQGLLTLENADGSTVECDLYPLLSRLR